MVRETTFAAVLALALSATLDTAISPSQNRTPSAPSSKAAIIPFTRLTPDATVPIGLAPGAVAASDGVWTADPAGNAIIRLDAKTNTADPPIALAGTPCASLALAFEALWAPLCSTHTVARVALKDRR